MSNPSKIPAPQREPAAIFYRSHSRNQHSAARSDGRRAVGLVSRSVARDGRQHAGPSRPRVCRNHEQCRRDAAPRFPHQKPDHRRGFRHRNGGHGSGAVQPHRARRRSAGLRRRLFFQPHAARWPSAWARSVTVIEQRMGHGLHDRTKSKRRFPKMNAPKVVAIVHAETSTGVLQPLEEIIATRARTWRAGCRRRRDELGRLSAFQSTNGNWTCVFPARKNASARRRDFRRSLSTQRAMDVFMIAKRRCNLVSRYVAGRNTTGAIARRRTSLSSHRALERAFWFARSAAHDADRRLGKPLGAPRVAFARADGRAFGDLA